MSYEKFQNFGSVLEAEVLDEQQMNSLEAGAKCQGGCKKSCQPGNQNSNVEVEIESDFYISPENIQKVIDGNPQSCD